MPKVLIVEDDPAMAALLERGLTDEGYEVTRVDNGVEALIQATTGEFSAAAIDVMLPEMNGFEICRHLRNQGNLLPVLLLTARDSVDDRVFGLDSGADDYLTKPFAFVELSARIRALVRRDSATPKQLMRIGHLSLDVPAVRASIDGKSLPLSTKEFSLLRVLAARAGETVTRTEILEEVWGTTRHIDPTIVDQYVRYLRKKLQPFESGITIGTVRGTGYTLSDDTAE
ncbi:response regulator transcription factor [Galbitalea soli]|uniref:Response regulator transcription factor n=1 Tax=Galbitalea soli TaxID=1268042 RepID=A0A7C9PLD3_9MICO|nr:response regulator transcription factor [Galbitalea soli]NEM90086.1 response regulator transcription factor [Galbitalea soli]NYJ30793.1 two-component system OmpR family response regulator [Galbitalea soli]